MLEMLSLLSYGGNNYYLTLIHLFDAKLLWRKL